MIYFVSRHSGAIEWIKTQKEWSIDQFITHLEIDTIQEGDTVLGTLPIHLAAKVCEKGALFYFLSLPQTEEKRGSEYTAEEMQKMNCSLQRFHITTA